MLYRVNIVITNSDPVKDSDFIVQMASLYGFQDYAGEYTSEGYNYMFTGESKDSRGFVRELRSAGFNIFTVHTLEQRGGVWKPPKDSVKYDKYNKYS